VQDLRTLDLSANALTEPPEGVLTSVNRLTNLSLTRNVISTLPEASFAGVPDLETLDLSSNDLTALPEGVFTGLSGLTTLLLSNNALETLPKEVFADVQDLTTLDLSSNNLTNNLTNNPTALPEGVFDVTGLAELKLQNNSIASLPGGLFNKTVSLVTLDLAHNALSSLPGHLFDKTESLVTLNLTHNALSSLPGGLFDKTESLVTLNLTHNALPSLPGGLFDKTKSLRKLTLANNCLHRLAAGLFDSLGRLESLDLRNNILGAQPPGLLAPLRDLTELLTSANGRILENDTSKRDNTPCFYELPPMLEGSNYILGNVGKGEVLLPRDIESLQVRLCTLADLSGESLTCGKYSFSTNATGGLTHAFREECISSSSDAESSNSGCGSCRWLNLSSSRVRSLETGVFEGLDELEYLGIAPDGAHETRNSLRIAEVLTATRGLLLNSSLRRLDIRSCGTCTFFLRGVVDVDVADETGAELSRVQFVNAECGGGSGQDQEVCNGTLDLSDAELGLSSSPFDEVVFTGLKHLDRLDLRDNAFTTFPPLDSFGSSDFRAVVDLRRNELSSTFISDIDCSLISLITDSNETGRSAIVVDIFNITRIVHSGLNPGDCTCPRGYVMIQVSGEEYECVLDFWSDFWLEFFLPLVVPVVSVFVFLLFQFEMLSCLPQSCQEDSDASQTTRRP